MVKGLPWKGSRSLVAARGFEPHPLRQTTKRKDSLLVCMKYLISFIDAGVRTQIGLMATAIGLLAYYKRDFHFSSCTTCQSTGTSCAAMAKISMTGLV